jgi:hypothetical protein
MQTSIYYVIEPTATLREIASSAVQDGFFQRAVWEVLTHDRTGDEYTKEDVSRAHWIQFIANLYRGPHEPAMVTELRQKCLSLGFEGCWIVSEAEFGGAANDLMAAAQEAQELLSKRGITIP